MTDDNMYEYRFDLSKTTMPKLGGTLTDTQRAEVENWTHVPPFDGFTYQLKNTDGVMGNMHQQMLSGFRGMILSELISIEYLLAAVPLAKKLKDEADFSLKFWEGMNKNSLQFGRRMKQCKACIDGRFIQMTPENFDTATEFLLDVRNALAHYPLQAAFNGEDDTLTPFVYRASKGQMLVFDDHTIQVLDTFCSMVKSELQAHFDQLKLFQNLETK